MLLTVLENYTQSNNCLFIEKYQMNHFILHYASKGKINVKIQQDK